MSLWIPLWLAIGSAGSANAADLLFRLSADAGTCADVAGGDPAPNFQESISIVPNGVGKSALRQEDDGAISWNAPGNLYARAGTVSFYWRPRNPVDGSPFALFRASFAEHSSFDMTFLRIDWNGHGFDAFVTDQNLARVRVSYQMQSLPPADSWHHIAFSWDEGVGVRLYFDGREVARRDQAADLDSALDQFGFAGRVISPHQVHSRFNFMRGSDFDELRIHDYPLDEADVRLLAAGGEPAAKQDIRPVSSSSTWLHRFGWDAGSPPEVVGNETTVRKIEFSRAIDIKQEMWKGVDGIAETTWPGVYNRSRLPGRNDYFPLPDWNVYVEGGKDYLLTIPDAERVNRIELRGAAFGVLEYQAPDESGFHPVFSRSEGPVRSVHAIAPLQGGVLRFRNTLPETPIQEFWAYEVMDRRAPVGVASLLYRVGSVDPRNIEALGTLTAAIRGRFSPTERSTLVALPENAKIRESNGPAASGPVAPIVHILVPSRFDVSAAGVPPLRSWNYGWQNFNAGLDGIEIGLPPLDLGANKDGLIPLNIRVRDPLWPGRDLMDVSISVRPGQAHRLFLDVRDRLLSDDSLWISIASPIPDFGATKLSGTTIRLVFKDRAAAKVEHIADRFRQVKDNWAFLVEARPATTRAGLYRRLLTDISDLLRVDPENIEARRYWGEISYSSEDWPSFEQPVPPAGVPLWAFRQVEELKLVGRFVNWWIDQRQSKYGDFGGGISDDTDLIAQWPGLALMGVEPDKIRDSLNRLTDAAWANGMHAEGLNAIATDELHAYEEGLNADAAALYLSWGDPLRLERLMATTKALRERIILTNPAGHQHFASNWYGGREIHRSGPWEWQKQYSFVVLHAPQLLGLYNANAIARGTVTGVVEGLLAHGQEQPDGSWRFPNEINWRKDTERSGDPGGSFAMPQSAWASWRWTGEDRYLRPILSRVAIDGPASVAHLNENVIDALGKRDEWGAVLLSQALSGGAFEQYAAWALTGDKQWLERLHGAAIESKSQREYMLTEGHWWTDRVEQPSEILQRERLGGVALKRNWTWPGHSVSWRFDENGGAEQVAILLPGATPDRIKIIAYNLSDREQRATMTGWNVTAGRWRVSSGIDGDGDDVADEIDHVKTIGFERGQDIDILFAPRQTTVIELELEQPSTPVELRPDLGISARDISVSGRDIAVTIHSLGHVDTPAGIMRLQDSAGRVIAETPIAPLAAPVDLVPRTATTRIRVPTGVSLFDLTVDVALSGAASEVTMLNNRVTLSEVIK